MGTNNGGGWKDPIGEPHGFVGLKVPHKDIGQIDEIAKKAGRSRSAVVREAITRYLEPTEAA